MQTFITDSQDVGEASSTLFTMFQEGPIDCSITMKNVGTNTMNYRYQEYNGTAWVDLGASGSDYYNTLSASEVKLILLTSNYPKVQLIGNASGGAVLEFAIARYLNRSSGGTLPLMSL